MRALPSSLTESRDDLITGLSCPECMGVLGVNLEGREALLFRCRIGHTYSMEEVVIGKEETIGKHLWAAVTALTELATFLRELVVMGRATDPAAYEQRARTAAEQERRIRAIIEECPPVMLPPGDEPDESTV